MVRLNYPDTHMHTSFSVDSKEDARNYFDAALIENIDYLITTDHFDFDVANIPGNNWCYDLDEAFSYMQNLEKEYRCIKYLRGIEIGYKKEHLDEIRSIIKNNHFDQIILSIHEDGVLDYYDKEVFNKYGTENVLANYFSQMKEALLNTEGIQILGHLDYGLKTAYLLTGIDYTNTFKAEITKILQLLIDKGIALEINTKVQKYFPASHLDALLDIYKSLGGTLLTLASDAHEVGRYREGFSEYALLIKRSGFKSLVYFIDKKKIDFLL